MSASLFASTIIDKVNAAIGRVGQNYTESSVYTAMEAVAQGITEYIIQNTTVTVQYTGMVQVAVPYPDPVVADTFTVVGNCAPTGPSDHFDDWIRKIETNIITGFDLTPSGTAGITFAQKPFLVPGIPTLRSQLTAAYDISDEDPQHKVWEIICGGIMDWINGIAMNVTPGAATRPLGPSVGTAVITKITIT